MLSKFMTTCIRGQAPKLLASKPKIDVYKKQERPIFGLVPPSHYDVPIPARFNLFYVMQVYWEICPVIMVTVFALSCMIGSIVWAVGNKVDAVYTSRSRNNISRTMNLRNPTVHKLVVIHQKYEPWPEMAAVLDKMTHAERRAAKRAQSCSHP